MTAPSGMKVTVGDLAASGIDEVDAMCVRCGSVWRSPISFLPPATTLEKIAELMSCRACGGREIDVEPPEIVGGVIH